LLDEEPSLSWSAPGVGPDVVKRLRKRYWPVDDELDLHGLTRDDARRQVDAWLRRANKRGQRCVRIIHGVGYGSAGGEPVLRGVLHSWLVQTEEVIAFCAANRNDGGNGALIAPAATPCVTLALQLIIKRIHHRSRAPHWACGTGKMRLPAVARIIDQRIA
jgi:DNA-nicking Smr family endonuclease